MQDASASDDEAAPPVSAVQLQPLDEAAALEAELDGQTKPSSAASADGPPDETSEDDEDGAQLSGEDDGDTSSDDDVEQDGDDAADDTSAADAATVALAHPTSEDGPEARARKTAIFESGVRALKRRSDSDNKQQVGHHSEPACSSA